jgi:hypothetical protein
MTRRSLVVLVLVRRAPVARRAVGFPSGRRAVQLPVKIANAWPCGGRSTARGAGSSVLVVSHNMPHVVEVADRIHIARLGRRAAMVTGAV